MPLQAAGAVCVLAAFALALTSCTATPKPQTAPPAAAESEAPASAEAPAPRPAPAGEAPEEALKEAEGPEEIPAESVVVQTPGGTSPRAGETAGTLPAPRSSARPPAQPAAPSRTIRVGLATDLSEVALPCCDPQLRLKAGETTLVLTGPAKIQPGEEVVTALRYRLQVAALKDEEQALALAGRLQKRLGQPADARFDAATDLYRVRVGSWRSRPEAEAAQGRLEASGLGKGWIAQEGTGLKSPSLTLVQGDKAYKVTGRWLRVAGETSDGQGLVPAVRWKGVRYRGGLAVYLNDRGKLNVVNEIGLEDYLRGVIPKEMGPMQYPQLEALKAQAVAARSYTLRHLGEFKAEGYDICATPRCHVYGGLDAEQPLTNQALAETAGQVLAFGGQTADAMYTATCGGRTENVEVIFPGLPPAPYLRGVPCLEAGLETVEGSLPRGTTLGAGLAGLLLPAVSGSDVHRLEGHLVGLARLAGLPLPDDALRSTERGEVQRYVASLFDLALDVRLLAAREDLAARVAEPPPGWDEETRRQGELLLATGLFQGAPGAALTADEAEQIVVPLARLLRVVTVEEAHFLQHHDGKIIVRLASGDLRQHTLPKDLATFLHPDGRPARAGRLTLVAGDRLDLVSAGGELLALVREGESDGGPLGPLSPRASWTRFHSDAEIARVVQERYPGLGFTGFEILERGPSGRVQRIRLQGKGGKSVEVEGLAVRWTLDVPETLFTAQRTTSSGGAPGWAFRGKGWGHGVGMCQEGAYGMAQRGHDYREILRHYYLGADVAPMPSQAVAAASPAEGAAGEPTAGGSLEAARLW